MAVLIAYALLSLKLGMRAFYSYEFAQTLIIFIFSAPNPNLDLVNFASWFQFAKFDFGVLNKFDVMMFIKCSSEPSKMTSVQFYCQTTILNYFSFLVIISLVALLILVFKHYSHKYDWKLKVYTVSVKIINKISVLWMLIHTMLPFIWINITSELLEINKNSILSLILLCLIILILLLLIFKKREIFAIKTIYEIDSLSPVSFTLLTIVKVITHVWLFIMANKSIQKIWILIEFAIHLTIGKITSDILIIKGT